MCAAQSGVDESLGGCTVLIDRLGGDGGRDRVVGDDDEDAPAS
jgi:hypothetical protein